MSQATHEPIEEANSGNVKLMCSVRTRIFTSFETLDCINFSTRLLNSEIIFYLACRDGALKFTLNLNGCELFLYCLLLLCDRLEGIYLRTAVFKYARFGMLTLLRQASAKVDIEGLTVTYLWIKVDILHAKRLEVTMLLYLISGASVDVFVSVCLLLGRTNQTVGGAIIGAVKIFHLVGGVKK